MKNKGIFLVARYFMKPKDHVRTEKAGWMKDPNNIRWDEQMVVSNGIKNKDRDSQVILNLSKKTVVRNTFRQETDFDEIFLYYLNGYSKYLVPVMSQIDPAYIEAIARELQAQLPPETMTNEEMQAAQSSNIIDVKHEEVQAQ
jgi:hypothetical protein